MKFSSLHMHISRKDIEFSREKLMHPDIIRTGYSMPDLITTGQRVPLQFHECPHHHQATNRQ